MPRDKNKQPASRLCNGLSAVDPDLLQSWLDYLNGCIEECNQNDD